jgi:hypothetical protein
MLPLGSSDLVELKNAPKNGIVGAALSALAPSVERSFLRAKVEWERGKLAG